MNTSTDSFEPPSAAILRRLFALPRAYFSPFFSGLENFDSARPALWVGNHTMYGLLDVPLMGEHLLSEHGVVLRSLGDRGHFKVPLWGKALGRVGMVLGSQENCRALMKQGQHILVFPGGGREVMRRKGEAYQLIWKQRTGFARMAIEHGYDIIPFASLGPDEVMDILVDADDVTRSALWRWLSRKLPLDQITRGGDMIPPLARGLGPSLIPKPQRFYFRFGERIPTAHLSGREDDRAVHWALREQVARAIEEQLDWLREYRIHDKRNKWGRLRRWMTE